MSNVVMRPKTPADSTSGEPPKPKLLDEVRARIRRLNYSIRTEEAYVDWVRRFVLFHDKRHPRDMGGAQIEAFLTHLAVVGRVSASTQNQAKSALLFLYREVLGIDLPWLDDIASARQGKRLPVVLTMAEVQAVLARVTGTTGLMLRLLYGSGLRLMECVRLRVKDVDFGQMQILVRDGKGDKDRVTMLPQSLVEPLRTHLERVKALHQRDIEEGYGEVYLPYALDRKYPNAGREWGWQYVFPSTKRSVDPRSGVIRRHHGDGLQRHPAPRHHRTDVVGGELECLGGRAGRLPPHRTHCATALPRMCFRRVTTSAPCRSCWATPTLKPP